jgi:hypothetical protein
VPARLPITDEQRRERKRAQDHNAHIRRMERCGFVTRNPVHAVVPASELYRGHCKYEIKEREPCA